MASSTVLRVKRRLDDNPQDALVLMCKRMKTDTEEISPSLFVYRGTVKTLETSNVRTVVPKTDLKLRFTSNVQDIIQKLRKERKQQSTESRYEVVNCSRGLNISEADDQIDLVDLQISSEQKSAEDYAYDLYTAAKQDFDFEVSLLDKLISIEHYKTDLILGANDDGDSLDGADDEDDSNDENNWRNDYPDSERSSIDEQDMILAMERVDLDNDLSTDDDQDIYEPAVADDVTRYGAAYARYKAKVMATHPDLNDSRGLVLRSKVNDMDEESIDGYKDDSDDGFYYGEDDENDDRLRNYSDCDSNVPD